MGSPSEQQQLLALLLPVPGPVPLVLAPQDVPVEDVAPDLPDPVVDPVAVPVPALVLANQTTFRIRGISCWRFSSSILVLLPIRTLDIQSVFLASSCSDTYTGIWAWTGAPLVRISPSLLGIFC